MSEMLDVRHCWVSVFGSALSQEVDHEPGGNAAASQQLLPARLDARA